MKARTISRSPVLLLALTVILISFCTVPAFANAAEPPCFTILVNGAPEDLSMTFLHSDGTELPLAPLKRGWESYFRCFYSDLSPEKSDITRGTLQIQSASENISYTIDFPDSLTQTYNNIFTLKLADGTLSDSYPA